MTHEEFDKLVRGVETGIGRDHAALYRHVRRWAALGYAGLLLPPAALVLISAALIVPGILWPSDLIWLLCVGVLLLVLGGWAAGRAIWVVMKAPKGRELSRDEAPGLFAKLEEIRKQTRSAPFDRVLIVPDFNAFCAPRPRLGVLGWNQNYLMLGLPLMDGLAPEEFTAVLAHECAHLSKEHHRSGQWVYRLRRSWQQVFESRLRPGARSRGSPRQWTQKFIDWFWPRFNAHAFVLARAQEYQADAVAAKLAGVSNMTTALIRIAWYGRVLEETFWPRLRQESIASAEPPNKVFERICEAVGGIHREGEAKWLEQAFRTTTTNADTHPCLADRLRALGWAAGGANGDIRPAPTPPRPTAAEFFLGATLRKLRTEVEQAWWKELEPEWRKEYAKTHVLQDRIGQLDQVAAAKHADVDMLWDKARMLLDMQQRENALPLLRQILETDPRHVFASFSLGSCLLQSDTSGGEAYLEQAIAENEEMLPQAANVLHAYFQRTGQVERIRELYARLDRHGKAVTASRAELATVSATDTFIAPELAEPELRSLREILAAQPDLATAHLGLKKLKYFTRQKFYLLCVTIRPRWHRLPNADREDFVVKQLIKEARLPGRVLIFTNRGSFGAVARKLAQVPGTKIFPEP